MTDYIKREDLLNALNAQRIEYNAAVNETIIKLPSADVVEVVRCKDCKRCEVYYPRKAKGKEAEIAYYCTNLDCVVEPTDFCSYGVRKGEE